MITSFQKNLNFILPAVILIMVFGLLFSRVFQHESGIPKPEITISSTEAKNHIGMAAEVCGEVFNARFISQIDGKPTFINFDRADPNQTFTAVIWGGNLPKWSESPEDIYPNNDICVTGRIKSHEGTPQIEVIKPDQIKVQ